MKQDYTVFCSKKAWNPTESSDIIQLAKQIPSIWNSSSSTPNEKKRIIRILIEDVTVMAETGKSAFSIGIRFRSGHNETLPLVKPGKRCDEVRHSEEIITLIRELSQSMNDAEIVSYLKDKMIFTKTGGEFTIPSIKWIRYKHRIPSPYLSSRQGLSVQETAVLLGISPGKVYYYIDKGIIPAAKQHPGWAWEILLDSKKTEELKNLLQ